MKKVFDCVYPCPCGFYGDSQKPCTYAPATVTNPFAHVVKPLIYNALVSRRTTHPTSSAMQTCASGRYGSFAGCRMRVRV